MKGNKSAPLGIQTSLFDEASVSRGELASGQSPPVPAAPERDARSTAVWRQWLSSMANDAEAALAAAIAYRDMDAGGRERWLSSLEVDAPAVDVPVVALYAPLLAVENDPERRERLIDALGDTFERGDDSAEAASGTPPQAFFGRSADGTHVYVIATPLYLKFSQVLACGVAHGQFQWVKHDPIVGPTGVPKAGEELAGAHLQRGSMRMVLDELAAAVLSHQRSGKTLPDGLSILGDLLGPLSR